MNDFEERIQAVGNLYEALEPKQREIVNIYVEHLRELLGQFDDMHHIVYLGIALDFVAAEMFSAIGKPI